MKKIILVLLSILFATPCFAAKHPTVTLTNSQPTFAGNGRWKFEILVDASKTKVAAGADKPDETTRQVGASGGVYTQVLAFDATTEESKYLIIHAPAGIDGTVDVEIHLIWIPDSTWASGAFVWNFECIVKNEDDTLNTGTPATITETVTPANATDSIETVFSTTVTMAASQVAYMRAYRKAADAADTATVDGQVITYEAEVTMKQLGESI